MDSARWARIESICMEALERPARARESFLDEHCAGDADLRHQVESLIDHIEKDPSFLERPIVDFSSADDAPIPDETPGSTIGTYRVVRRLGRGGMGEVFLAVQQVEDVRRHVAIKIVRRGSDTEDLVRRFRLERRILAALNHPNIARLLDAGATEDGRPYVVMEHVEGSPIDVYCDERRLSIEARLGLFQIICDAVQHAHQNLVVHRDIKPTNILVSDTGVPKLLDFGIGKVLDDSDTFGPAVETRTNLRLLTPEYAAPEQIAGGVVTTATDVYALGVLLYVLLAGRHPYLVGGESIREIEHAVLNATPPNPSAAVTDSPAAVLTGGGATPGSRGVGGQRSNDVGQLRRRLAGDLDNIVLKALRKEPERRYASAAALGDDTRRHLRGLPVTARADTFGYRARKFIRRHAAPVAAAAIAFVALATTTAITLVQSGRVARESERVALERDKALEVQSFLMEMFGTSAADQAVGDSVTARQLLDGQAALLDASYDDRPDLKADMLMVLADGYDRLGLPAAAEPLASEALTIRQNALGPRHEDTAASLTLLGWIIRQTGRPGDAEPLVGEAAEILRAGGAAHRVALSRSLNDLGVILIDLGRHAEAVTVLQEALDIRLAALGENHRSVGITANNLTSAYAQLAQLDEAIRIQETAIRALAGSVGPEHRRTLIAQGNLATLRYMTGDREGATRDYRVLLETHTRVLGRTNPATTDILIALANVLGSQAAASQRSELFDEAESLAREAARIREETLGPAHPTLGEALDHLANILRARGNLPPALATGRRAVAIFREVYGENHPATGGAVLRVAGVLWRGGRVDAAIEQQRRAAAIFEATAGISDGQTAATLGTLCDMLMYPAEIAPDALSTCHTADEALARGPASAAATRTQVRLRLAQLYLRAGRRTVADSIVSVVSSSAAAGDRPPPQTELFEQIRAALAEGR